MTATFLALAASGATALAATPASAAPVSVSPASVSPAGLAAAVVGRDFSGLGRGSTVDSAAAAAIDHATQLAAAAGFVNCTTTEVLRFQTDKFAFAIATIHCVA